MKALRYALAATSFALLAACGGGGGGGGGVSEQGGVDGRVNNVFYAITTIAGLAGQSGSADGTGNAARFNYPSSAAVDSSGNLYVADYGNNTIRKITSSGVVTTIAGASGQAGSANGTGNTARFDHPISTSIDSSGNIYVADHVGHTIRKITSSGVVTTIAGLAGQPGSTDGTGNAARFNYPNSATVDSSGNLYVADYGNNTIRKITSSGVVTTIAGASGQAGSADGTGNAARFDHPISTSLDSSGNIYVADHVGHTIRKITSSGVVTTIAGLAGQSGSADGTGNAARFNYPSSAAVDSSGNLYVADYGNNTIRKITSSGVVTTIAGASGQAGSADGTGNAARFDYPISTSIDSSGNIYVADHVGHTIRKIVARSQ